MTQAPVDLSEFYKLSRPKKPPCQVGLAAAQLPDDQRASLAAASTADPLLITAGAVAEWLAKRNHEVTTSAVVAHRKGTCSCGRAT